MVGPRRRTLKLAMVSSPCLDLSMDPSGGRRWAGRRLDRLWGTHFVSSGVSRLVCCLLGYPLDHRRAQLNADGLRALGTDVGDAFLVLGEACHVEFHRLDLHTDNLLLAVWALHGHGDTPFPGPIAGGGIVSDLPARTRDPDATVPAAPGPLAPRPRARCETRGARSPGGRLSATSHCLPAVFRPLSESRSHRPICLPGVSDPSDASRQVRMPDTCDERLAGSPQWAITIHLSIGLLSTQMDFVHAGRRLESFQDEFKGFVGHLHPSRLGNFSKAA